MSINHALHVLSVAVLQGGQGGRCPHPKAWPPQRPPQLKQPYIGYIHYIRLKPSYKIEHRPPQVRLWAPTGSPKRKSLEPPLLFRVFWYFRGGLQHRFQYLNERLKLICLTRTISDNMHSAM